MRRFWELRGIVKHGYANASAIERTSTGGIESSKGERTRVVDFGGAVERKRTIRTARTRLRNQAGRLRPAEEKRQTNTAREESYPSLNWVSLNPFTLTLIAEA